jgi:hypothetical protein
LPVPCRPPPLHPPPPQNARIVRLIELGMLPASAASEAAGAASSGAAADFATPSAMGHGGLPLAGHDDDEETGADDSSPRRPLASVSLSVQRLALSPDAKPLHGDGGTSSGGSRRSTGSEVELAGRSIGSFGPPGVVDSP